ncbi:c-type cytochrome [Altererythrobacter sp. Z27]|uniref:c-type cytochrome n=1 Tax=Altererythrobacter sp. Z27 TaxID=3461147 RepID=UPI004043FDB0
MKSPATALAVLALAACSANEAPLQPVEQLRFERVSSNQIEHGKRVATLLGCNGCHGKDFTGKDWSDPELGVLWTANLTRSAELHSDDELLAMIATGRRPDRAMSEMPSHLFTHVHEDDLRAVLAYLRSVPASDEIHPAPTIGPKLAELKAAGEYLDSTQRVAKEGDAWPPDLGPQHAMARHIVRATCAECHEIDLKGGPAPLPGDAVRPDLTMMVPAYEPADFAKLMRTGKATGDREVGLMSEVSRNRFAHFTDKEVEAIRLYLVEAGGVTQ